jgi:isoquinoline 1-oxidoreductase alpha subunit
MLSQQGIITMRTLIINGKYYDSAYDTDEKLLWVLRDELGLTGTKFGCGAGICGACTVLMNGVPVRSCTVPVSSALGKRVTTVEGLAVQLPDGNEVLHPVQQAFIDEQVPQCGWCMSGQMMTAVAFLQSNPNPTMEEIDQAMGNNYCRCGCYARIRSAVSRAADTIAATLPDNKTKRRKR